MSQLDELSGDTMLANDVCAANITRHSDQCTPPKSPASPKGRL